MPRMSRIPRLGRNTRNTRLTRLNRLTWIARMARVPILPTLPRLTRLPRLPRLGRLTGLTRLDRLTRAITERLTGGAGPEGLYRLTVFATHNRRTTTVSPTRRRRFIRQIRLTRTDRITITKRMPRLTRLTRGIVVPFGQPGSLFVNKCALLGAGGYLRTWIHTFPYCYPIYVNNLAYRFIWYRVIVYKLCLAGNIGRIQTCEDRNRGGRPEEEATPSKKGSALRSRRSTSSPTDAMPPRIDGWELATGDAPLAKTSLLEGLTAQPHHVYLGQKSLQAELRRITARQDQTDTTARRDGSAAAKSCIAALGKPNTCAIDSRIRPCSRNAFLANTYQRWLFRRSER